MSPGCTIANGCFKHPAYIRQEPQSTCGNDDSCWRCNWSSARGTSAPETWDIRNSFHITPLYKLCLQCSCIAHPVRLDIAQLRPFFDDVRGLSQVSTVSRIRVPYTPRILHTCLLGLSQSYLIIPACLVLSPWFSLHSKILGHLSFAQAVGSVSSTCRSGNSMDNLTTQVTMFVLALMSNGPGSWFKLETFAGHSCKNDLFLAFFLEKDSQPVYFETVCCWFL